MPVGYSDPNGPTDARYFNATIDGVETRFGQAFNQTFLLQAFWLLKNIENLRASDPMDSSKAPVSLKDICFKPLDKDCATQSIFTYFLDLESNIKKSDYLERISTCTRLVAIHTLFCIFFFIFVHTELVDPVSDFESPSSVMAMSYLFLTLILI